MTTESVVIVGAGQSGGRAAALLRQEGFEGAITLIGAETHAPYERPPLSKAVLKGEKEPESCFLYDSAFYQENRIDLKLGASVGAIDATTKTVTLADGETLSFGALIIATGGIVKTLTLPGSDLPGVHVVRTIDDSLALQKDLSPSARVAVIGGGFIGLETAASARQMGCDVTVLEGAPRMLGRSVPEEVAAAAEGQGAGGGGHDHLGRKRRARLTGTGVRDARDGLPPTARSHAKRPPHRYPTERAAADNKSG